MDVLGFLEEPLDLVRLVQVTHKLALQVILDVVHQEVHDGLGHRILDVLTHDQEIGLDQTLWG